MCAGTTSTLCDAGRTGAARRRMHPAVRHDVTTMAIMTATPSIAPAGRDRRPTIGVIGGGQLGRMLTLAATPLGFDVVVLDPGSASPAAQVGAQQIVGDFHDPAALRKLAEASDFVTIEFEHLDADALQEISETSDARFDPAPPTIRLIQDKLRQKDFLQRHGVPVGPFAPVADASDAETALDAYGSMVLKTRTGGFDGRGNARVTSRAELATALENFGAAPLYAEQVVPFVKELAVMVARSTTGEISAYPVVETVHERNICVEVLAPAPVDAATAAKAERLATDVAGLLEGAGMFGIEMFLTAAGEVLVNEIAPRVHNSGHYTQDASRTSQFEQHVRAITGLPLGPTYLTAPAAAMVNVLGERDGPTEVAGVADALAVPQTNLHLYGKSPTKVDRKMGHITATGGDVTEARERARAARRRLTV